MRFRYRKGFGVHSPFVYNLITKVIEEKASFYAFEEIENFREKLLNELNELGRITAKETQSPNYGAFLFRLLNFFRCKSVIQIGSSTGVMSLYLASVSPVQAECYFLEERPLLQEAEAFAVVHHLQKAHFVTGDYKEKLPKIKTLLPKAEMIFINQLPDSMEMEKVLAWVEDFSTPVSIVLVNGIKKKKINSLWQRLKNLPQARVTMDLKVLGIVFFDNKLPKRHYNTHFNYGKKQNLYKNGRRRLHFIGRRKKGAENLSTH
ncbi:hypothetical protein AGMMS50262_15310 [Bacteroidia bacterium]|nr:hypothetical protein AGMMS50262_15310 [Bacteroidia bacterium]